MTEGFLLSGEARLAFDALMKAETWDEQAAAMEKRKREGYF